MVCVFGLSNHGSQGRVEYPSSTKDKEYDHHDICGFQCISVNIGKHKGARHYRRMINSKLYSNWSAKVP